MNLQDIGPSVCIFNRSLAISFSNDRNLKNEWNRDLCFAIRKEIEHRHRYGEFVYALPTTP